MHNISKKAEKDKASYFYQKQALVIKDNQEPNISYTCALKAINA